MSQKSQHELFRRQWIHWQPRIYAYIRTLVFRRADAEDVLQDVASVLWEKIDEFEPDTRFDQWAMLVARNKVMNLQKKKARERLKFSEAFESILADELASETEESGDLVDALESCLAKLSPGDSDLIARRYEPGATNRTVARTMNRSESTISRALNKIYQQLMHCIDASTRAAYRVQEQ